MMKMSEMMKITELDIKKREHLAGSMKKFDLNAFLREFPSDAHFSERDRQEWIHIFDTGFDFDGNRAYIHGVMGMSHDDFVKMIEQW